MNEGWTEELLSEKLRENPALSVVVNENRAGNATGRAREGIKPILGRGHPERDLEQFVHDTARMFGLLYYHTYRSKFSEPGFPDCFIIGKYMLVAELKNTGKKPTVAQQSWLDAFKVMGVPVYVWHPEDKDEIIKTLEAMRLYD